MANHSPVGGSGIDRFHFDACPGSVAMAAHYENTSSFAAREGTVAHEIGERSLSAGVRSEVYEGCQIDGIEVCETMTDHLQGYVDHCNGLKMFGTEAHIEVQHAMSFNPLIRGTADHLVLDAINSMMQLTDLKYGYIPVLPTTMQLKYYAALMREKFGPFKHYVLGIYQPRLYDGKPAKHIVCTDDDIVRFTEVDLIPSVELAMTHNAVRRPGKHCTWCVGKMACPELKEKVQYLQPPFNISNDDLAASLALESPIKNRVEDLKKEATRRLMSGASVPGFKPIRKLGKGQIKDVAGCVKALVDAGHDPHKKVLKGLTDLRKLDKNITNKFVVRDEGKTTVAPLSDSTPAVATLLDQFGALNNG